MEPAQFRLPGHFAERKAKCCCTMTAMAPYVSSVMSSVQQQMLLFPSEAQDFSVCVEMSVETQSTKKYAVLRLFGLRNVHAEDVHRADANRRCKKKIQKQKKLKRTLSKKHKPLAKNKHKIP